MAISRQSVQLESCSILGLVYAYLISLLLERYNDLLKELSANWSILASFACISCITLKEASNEKVSNYKVVGDLNIYTWTSISLNLE